MKGEKQKIPTKLERNFETKNEKNVDEVFIQINQTQTNEEDSNIRKQATKN